MTSKEFYKNIKLNMTELFSVKPERWVLEPDKSITLKSSQGFLNIKCSHNVVTVKYDPANGKTIFRLASYANSSINMVANTLEIAMQVVAKVSFQN